jgi:hypothetical protein
MVFSSQSLIAASTCVRAAGSIRTPDRAMAASSPKVGCAR